VHVINDIIRTMDRGEVTTLVLLDLRAPFDTVDHCTLLDVLHRRSAVEGIPLLWFISYYYYLFRQHKYDITELNMNKVSNKDICA